MIIQLNTEWRIRSEPLNWICEQRMHGAKAKRHQWKPRAYCKSFDSAVVWCGRRRVMERPGEYNAEALPPLVAALDAIQEEVRDALEQYRKENPAAGDPASRVEISDPLKSLQTREVGDDHTE